jgi:2-iminoacetate synthase
VSASEPITADSGAPWHLRLAVEPIGRDLLCRITGGAAHVGALSLSVWRDERARTRCLTVEGHREQEIAVFAAHRLCKASRRTVACAVGIHFDSLESAQAHEIARIACGLAARAAREVEERRIRDALDRGGLQERLAAGAAPIEREFAEFLAVPLARLLEREGPRLAALRREHFGDEVAVFAPLYLSSACTNDCSYCGFRRSAPIERVRLDPSQALDEARALAAEGHRSLDLVTGEVPTDAFVDYVATVASRILGETPVRRLHLNLGSLSLEQLKRLRSSGAVGYHVYQETYDPSVYLAVHTNGPKRDMARRLEMPERVLEAGFPSVGLGVLLGLAPIEREVAMLAAHAHELRRLHPQVRIGFSLPRIRPADAACRCRGAVEVSDEVFVRALLFLRREFPDAHVTVTTREAPELRDELLRLGVTKVSAGVSTSPGGYASTRPDAAAQFSVRDRRSLAEVEIAIRAAALRPVVG